MRLVALEAVEVLFEHQLAAIGNKHGVNQRRPTCGRVAVDDRLYHARDRRLVQPEAFRAGGCPSIRAHRWFTVGIGRAARRPRKEFRGVLLRASSELDLAARVGPVDAQLLRGAQVFRGEPVLRRSGLGIRREFHVVAIPRHAVLHGWPVRVLFRVSEGRHERAVVGAEDAEIKGERIGERTQDADEGVLAGQRQGQRGCERLAGATGKTRVFRRGWPNPESVNILIGEPAAESPAVIRERELNSVAIRLEFGFHVADDGMPLIGATDDRQFTVKRFAESRFIGPEADQRLVGQSGRHAATEDGNQGENEPAGIEDFHSGSRVKFMIQFVSQFAPPSAVNACSQRGLSLAGIDQ